MSIYRVVLFILVLGVIALGASGCVMHRTVKDGNEVVAQGYVIKSPLIAP